jgi:hypothetical protein
MINLNVSVVTSKLILASTFQITDSSFLIYAGANEFEHSKNIFRKIIELRCNHIYICGPFNEYYQNLLLDELSEMKDRAFLTSRYDELDDECISDFLFLNQFYHIDEHRFFVPLCDKASDYTQVCGQFFQGLAKNKTVA